VNIWETSLKQFKGFNWEYREDTNTIWGWTYDWEDHSIHRFMLSLAKYEHYVSFTISADKDEDGMPLVVIWLKFDFQKDAMSFYDYMCDQSKTMGFRFEEKEVDL
jgi:hypothetical protein